MLELSLLEQSSVTEFRNRITDFSNIRENQTDLNQCNGDSETKIGTIHSQFSDSLHSMDSANACGALGRRFESDRARFLGIISNFFKN